MVSEPAAEGAVLDWPETLRRDIAYDSDTLQLCAVPSVRCRACVDHRAVVLEGRRHHTRNAFSPCEPGL